MPSAYQEMTAAELRLAMEDFARRGNTTGWASLLGEAVLDFASASQNSELLAAEQVFSDARYALFRDTSPQAWQAARKAAQDISGVLRPLGDYRVPRCGECGMRVRDGEACRGDFHTPAP